MPAATSSIQHENQHHVSSATRSITTNSDSISTLIPTQPNLFSSPCSPLSSISSTESSNFRPSHSHLPRLQIPYSPSTVDAEIRTTKNKRKQDFDDQEIPCRPLKKPSRIDAAIQVGSDVAVNNWESLVELIDDKLPEVFQLVAEMKEERLEVLAQMESMKEELARSRKIMQEYGIPREKWS